MRIELVVYITVLLALLLGISAINVGRPMEGEMANLCVSLVHTSSILGGIVDLPCDVNESSIVYRRASVELPVSYGVVVKNEHVAPP